MMWWKIGAIMGALGVGLGAFGAHGLQNLDLDPKALEWWTTGSKYHLIHALALLMVAAHPSRPNAAGWLFFVGILIFSGSLYTMSLTGIRVLGAITPLGGLSLIAGWVALALASTEGG